MPINKYKFERPPTAPVFKPTLKEFEDPLAYIENIRPIAQKYGICKIISPKQWNPPFSVDHNTFKFRPRVQRLNELGAKARLRNNFMQSIEAYWIYQNRLLIIPTICGIKIDLFTLHSLVRQYGGSHQVSKNKQWTIVCRELDMGDKAAHVSSQVKSSYETLIQPYLDFCDDKFMAANKELFPEDVPPTRTRGKTATTLESPKLTRSKTEKFKNQMTTHCKICESIEREETMVLCVECDLRFHITCLDPRLSDIISPWTCARCVQINCARELSRLDAQVFGFTQSTSKYSLGSFATYADNFKKTYFNNRNNVNMKEVEEEYWRLVAAEDGTDEDVTVKYGADISSGQTSSGFPTKLNRHLLLDNDQKYVDNGWNLNNLPVLNKSILRFVSNDISGMTVPWCYVGMVFSCFCWHIEDHWSYSINYMHTGECKTWYGVPESDADLFEELMRTEAGQLFDKSPDLLHHITTQINPTTLIKNNIKVYRLDQGPGEFVVTFPRAYHSGFNQGFNFAEAVNFCPADWLSKGRIAIDSYRLVKRPTVFSHNQLIYKMASCHDSLDFVLLKAVYDELIIVQHDEKAFRKQIDSTCRSERLPLDPITEEDRECVYCRTTLYMSAVTCTACCPTSRMVCLDHLSKVCTCPTMDNVILNYRLSLDEISAIVATVKNKLEQYNLWMKRVYHLAKSEFCSSPVSSEEGHVMRNVSQFMEDLGVLQIDHLLVQCAEGKPNLEELKMLLQLGRKLNCPELLLDFLDAIIDTCQRAMTMTEQLLKSHRRTSNEEDKENDENIKNESKSKNKNKEKKSSKIISRYEDQNDKLTLDEMRMLVAKLRSLPAHVPHLEEAAQILYAINEWRIKVKRIVPSNAVIDNNTLMELIVSGESNLVYLSEYQMLQKMRVHTLWIAEARQLMSGLERKTHLPSLNQLKKIRDEGLGLVNTVEIDRIATLSEILEIGEEEEEEEESINDVDELSEDYRFIGWNIVISNLKMYEKQLSKIITDGEAMQKEADDILKSTPGIFTLSALKILLKSGESKLSCVVPGIERLKEVLKEAVLVNTKISEMWQKLQLSRRLIHIDDMQALIKQADSLCVAFNYLADLKSLNETVELWKKNLHSLFIKGSHNSYLTTPSLLEVLFPRPSRMFKLMIARESVSSKLVAACKAESTSKKDEYAKEELDSCDDDKQSEDPKLLRNANRASRKNRGRQKRASFSSDDPQIARKDNLSAFESFLKSSASTEVESFNLPYKNMCINELEWMWNLRELNEDKASKDSSGHDFYCFCRKRGIDQKGAQVMCDLCQDWFHLTCLGIQNKDMSKKKFLCPQCERSKRPAFEVILAEKRKLEQEAKMLKIPEHIGLCLMSQRVISFHKHTNQLFSPQTELGAVFAEYKKLFGVQAILPKYQQQQSCTSGQNDQSPTHEHTLMETPLLNLATGKQSRKTPHSMLKSGISSANYPAPIPATPVQLSPVPSKETLMNIRRLKVSLSEDARRELEEIYIELCLLEVNQPTVTWIWKLYHSLIDDDEDEEETLSDRDKYAVKKELITEHLSDYSDTAVTSKDKFDARGLDYVSKLLGKSCKSTKRPDGPFHTEKYIKSECLTSPEERKEPLQKFSFKRKLVAKKLVQSPTHIKKQPTLKSGRGVNTRKRGRGGKSTAPYRGEAWDINTAISSEYYDEENDVILLDNVSINKPNKSKRKKTMSGSMKSVSDSKSIYEDNPTTSSKHRSTSGRQQKQSATIAYSKQISTEKSDYSDEHSPSQMTYDIKVGASNQPKRGRKPSVVASNSRATVSATLKRRRKGGRNSGGASKRVCNDDCEADECIQQSSDKVNWIACDLCNLWYHWICVDIKSAIEIGDRFICPHCKETKKQSRASNFVDNSNKLNLECIASMVGDDDGCGDDGEDEGDLETDDLNVTLDEEVVDDVHVSSSLTRVESLTDSVDMILRASSQVDNYSRTSHTSPPPPPSSSYFHHLSPPPPFLQPECCVQEEVVEISYLSRSDSD